MAIIAVAGGTGKLGRAIVEALRDTTSHSVHVLTRKEPDDVLAKELGVSFLPADYSNVESLTKVLESNKIDTVISAVSVIDDSNSIAQLNLIGAAERSSSTTRFIPSEYGVRYTEQHAAVFPVIKGKVAADAKLRSTKSLEYTSVSNGFFLDYYGLPKLKSYLQPFVFAVDVANNTAAIPGTGDVPIVFTHTFDVARFVAALVGEPNWPERSIVIGDKKSWNEFVAIAEDVKGVKFNTTHDSEELLNTFKVTELPSHPSVYPFLPKEQLQYILAVFGRWTAAGDFDLPDAESLNRRFPEIKPRSVRDVLEERWKA
ncbi:NAD(P)-binding protein [Aspergillus insuetus]